MRCFIDALADYVLFYSRSIKFYHESVLSFIKCFLVTYLRKLITVAATIKRSYRRSLFSVHVVNYTDGSLIPVISLHNGDVLSFIRKPLHLICSYLPGISCVFGRGDSCPCGALVLRPRWPRPWSWGSSPPLFSGGIWVSWV